MDGVQNITRGWWRPTPGSIYPLLKDLSDQGLVKKREDGRYELTQRGRQQADDAFGPRRAPRRPQTSDDVVGQLSSLVEYMEDLSRTAPDELGHHAQALEQLAKRLSDLAKRDVSKG